MALPANGTLSYNGITFSSLIKSKVSGEPVYDDAGRMVKYVKWTITVTGYINAGAGTAADTTFAALRKALTKVGQELHYDNKGFGTLTVNQSSSGVRDVAWGPKPELLSFAPIGDNQTVLLEWKVSTCIPECDNAVYQSAVLAFNYEVDYKIDVAGYLTITTTGYLEIPMTHPASGTTPPDNVDSYRERVKPTPLLGFEREQSFKVSADKRRLDFTFTDTQRGQVPLPEKAASVDADYGVRYRILAGATIIECNLSATVRVVASEPKTTAFDIFQVLLAEKMQAPLVSNLRRSFVGQLTKDNRRVVIPGDFEIRDQVFGKDVYFSATWRIIKSDIYSIIADSGMFASPPIFSWSSWQRSLNSAGALSVRGVAGLRQNASDDILIDLCNGNTVSRGASPGHASGGPNGGGPGGAPGAGNRARASGSGSGGQIRPPGGGGGSMGGDPNGAGGQYFPPENTWIAYNCMVELRQDNQIARHKPLTGSVRHSLPTAISTSDANSAAKVTKPPGSKYSASQKDILQETAAPNVQLALIGGAVRVGYDVEPPQLFTNNSNTTIIELSRRVSCGVITQMGGIPIIGCQWEIVYEVSGPVAAMPIVSNPQLNVGGRPELLTAISQ